MHLSNAVSYFVHKLQLDKKIVVIIAILIVIILISNGNRTEWSTIQGEIGRVISNQPCA